MRAESKSDDKRVEYLNGRKLVETRIGGEEATMPNGSREAPVFRPESCSHRGNMKNRVLFSVILSLWSSQVLGMNQVHTEPQFPTYTVIQENKPLRHYPSLLIATYKVSLSLTEGHYMTCVRDLDQAEEAAFYEQRSEGWYEAQMAHFRAWGWAMESFPPGAPVSDSLRLPEAWEDPLTPVEEEEPFPDRRGD